MPRAGGKLKAAGDGGLQKGNLTHQQRLAIVRKKDEEPRWTQEDLARWAKKTFGLLRQPTQSTISNILRSRERLETMTTSLAAKSVRPVKHPELDAALLLWLRDRQAQQLATTGDQVRDQARHLATLFHYVDEMTYSNGWMRSFLARHECPFRRNQVDPRETLMAHEVKSIIDSYPRQDVFTLVSTNLWYRLEPKKDPSAGRAKQQLGDGNASPVQEEPALLVGLAANMDGSEKWSPLFVARARQPPSFQQKTAFQWNFLEYHYNGRAQMTSTVFEVWAKRLNQRMAQSNRRVLIVLGSAPSHINVKLSHVRVIVHADTANMSLLSLSSGIASAFKAFYRKRQLAAAADRAEAGEQDRYVVSQLKAMRWVEQAWNEVPADLIEEAWSLVGLTPTPSDSSSAASKAEVDKAITSLLEQLDVPGRIKFHDVVSPRGEDDAPHYVYDDSSIVQLVAGALQNENDESAWETDIVDPSELGLASDMSGVTSHMHRSLLVKLEQFRGVIQCIDEETPPSEELTTVLAFLRRRQATLRADLQRLARESAHHHHHHHHNHQNQPQQQQQQQQQIQPQEQTQMQTQMQLQAPPQALPSSQAAQSGETTTLLV